MSMLRSKFGRLILLAIGIFILIGLFGHRPSTSAPISSSVVVHSHASSFAVESVYE